MFQTSGKFIRAEQSQHQGSHNNLRLNTISLTPPKQGECAPHEALEARLAQLRCIVGHQRRENLSSPDCGASWSPLQGCLACIHVPTSNCTVGVSRTAEPPDCHVQLNISRPRCTVLSMAVSEARRSCRKSCGGFKYIGVMYHTHSPIEVLL